MIQMKARSHIPQLYSHV